MNYERVNIDAAIEYVNSVADRTQKAKSGRELSEIRDEYLIEQKRIQTMVSLANIRFTLNTADKFYLGEKGYYDENLPRLAAAATQFNRAFLHNPSSSEALDIISPNVAKIYELSIKIADEKISADVAAENGIITEYSQLMSEMVFCYKGRNLPFSILRKYFDDSNRNVRRDAMETAGRTLSKNAEKLDDIFDRLVKTRNKMAKKMGFNSYSQMGDYRMGRYSYGRKEVNAFRNEIKTGVVPTVSELRTKRAAKLGISDIMLYDYETYFANGNPEPVIDNKKMFDEARKMYRDLGGDTAEFIDKMLAADAFDVFPKKGKWGGGYCTSIDDYGQPFVLANFNGSSGDVDVLTHEAGHAFAFYEQFKNNLDYELGTGTMSIAEIHSMAMEFFAWKYTDKFFGSRARDYRYYHLLSSLTFLPYGCEVDEFEETCYDNPDMPPAERNELWQKLDIYYRPYLKTQGIPYFEKGTRWQYQMHVYENPMYYIDYCLSQSVAHQFLILSQNDFDSAFDKYLNLVKKGGLLPFGELVEQSGLKNPLKSGVVTETTSAAAILTKQIESER